MEKVILKGFRGDEKKFNGKEAVVLKKFLNGGLGVRCLGLALVVKKHQYKEAK